MDAGKFSLCGVTLRVECQDPHQLSLINSQWQRFFILGDEVESAAAAVYSFRDPEQTGRVVPPGVEVFRSGHLMVLQTDRGAHIRCGSSSLDVDVANGRCQGVLSADFQDVPLQHQREFFLLSFLMILRPFGLYGLHANGLLHNGTGYLVVGASGSGKTTLSLALVREGWGFLADDAQMLQKTPQGIEALPLRRGFSCTAQTTARFPEFKRVADDAPLFSDGKKLVDISQEYPGSFFQSCYPGTLLFPAISNESHSKLVRIDATQGMMGLLEHSAGIMVNKQWVIEQMGVLKLLAEQSISYKLLLGTDVYEAPQAVAELLASVSNPKGMTVPEKRPPMRV